MEGSPKQDSNINQSGQLDRIEADADDGATSVPYSYEAEDLEALERASKEKKQKELWLKMWKEFDRDMSSHPPEWLWDKEELPVVSGSFLTYNRAKYASTFKAFLVSLLLSVIGLSPQFHWALLMLSCGFLIYQTKNITTQFYSQFGSSTNINAPHSLPLLSFSEALVKLLPVMKPITMFILSYPVILLLACPIQLILQIFIMLVLIFVPFHYFSELVGKVSSGVNVAFGPIHLPLIGFAILGAFALSLILLLVILLGLYLFWRCILKGRPSLKNLEGSVKDLSRILIGA